MNPFTVLLMPALFGIAVLIAVALMWFFARKTDMTLIIFPPNGGANRTLEPKLLPENVEPTQ